MEHNRHTDYAGNIELISCSGGKNIMAGADKLAIQMSLHNCFKLVSPEQFSSVYQIINPPPGITYYLHTC